MYKQKFLKYADKIIKKYVKNPINFYYIEDCFDLIDRNYHKQFKTKKEIEKDIINYLLTDKSITKINDDYNNKPNKFIAWNINNMENNLSEKFYPKFEKEKENFNPFSDKQLLINIDLFFGFKD